MMFILCSAADNVSSDNWFIVFKVVTLNADMLAMFLHLSKLGLGSVADFSNTGTRAPTSAEHTPCSPALRVMGFGCTV